MLNYSYNDLPIIKLLDNYSIWAINDKNVITIYLFDNDNELYLYAPELKIDTYIILNKGLLKYLNPLNNKNNNYYKINRYIQNTRIRLESIKNPKWEFFEEKIVDIKVKDINFDININKILSEICMFLKIHCGDIKQLANIITNIKYKFDLSKNEDKIFILINIKKTCISNKYKLLNCFNCEKNEDRYLVKYIISKPNNNDATNIAKYLMNEEIKNKINYMKNYK
jgi:hypothetical protein